MLMTFDISDAIAKKLLKGDIDVNSVFLGYLNTLEKSRVYAAENFINELLPEGRKVPAANMLAAAEMTGISNVTLHRAKFNMGVKSLKKGFGASAIWYWQR